MAVAAVSGAMAVTLPAHADSAADGSAAGSPGLISGNGVQLPVHLPVNLCGNTVNVVGVLNPAAGNTCANKGATAAPGKHGASSGGGGVAHGASSGGGATAHGTTQDSPGVVSGNGVQLPVHLPVNVSGNSVNVVGIANPAVGNESVNVSDEEPPPPVEHEPQPPTRHDPPVEPQHPGPRTVPQTPAVAPQRGVPEAASSLAHTGADATLPAVAGSAVLLLGGLALQRRFRPHTER
ncbi:chaplin [Streptomyces sp. NBC_01334]|uniref:chaplin n=1 Tax=Streptomyces sp. NBC_01334 TaxID=2903827 RepID=UPI002E1280DA|nr:chaplin [Streptomyces sp. NBC_01334]